MAQCKLVQQEDKSGCGLACIAMLSKPRRTYEDVKKHIYPPDVWDYEYDPSFYTNHKQLKRALDDFKIDRAESFVRCSTDWHVFKAKMDTVALVACGKKGEGNERVWHWVVFDGRSNLVYDPLRTEPYIPNNQNRRPFSYLEIHA